MRDLGARGVRIVVGALAATVLLAAMPDVGLSQSDPSESILRVAPVPVPAPVVPRGVVPPRPPILVTPPGSAQPSPSPSSAAVNVPNGTTGGAPSSGSQPAIPNEIWSQTANTSGGGGASGGGAGCGCPAIAPVATSDKPAAGRVYQELDLTVLEHLFSDREARYGGDWDKAMLALAHDMDPSGTLHLWTAPVPTPTDAQATVTEGGVSAYLLLHSGQAAAGAAADHPVFKGGSVSGGEAMTRIVQTLARINKFGEPSFGLRNALFSVARFLLDDLASVPSQDGIAAATASSARNGLASQLLMVDPRLILTGSPRNHSAKIDLQESEQDRFEGKPKATLEVDDYDRANAALDILMSVDEHDQIVGLVTYSVVREPRELVGYLIGIASARSLFGGAATANSPEDAIGCKALAVLAALLDYHRKYSPQWRDVAWAFFNEGLAAQTSFTQPKNPTHEYQNAKPAFLAERAALILGGFNNADQAREEAGQLINVSIDDSLRPTDQEYLRGYVPLINASTRDFETLSAGPAQAVFTDFVDQKWAALHANLEYLTKLGDPDGTEPAIKNWDASQPDLTKVAVGKLCPLPATPPRVLLLAKGVLHDFVVDKFYVGVPMAIEVTFDEPYAADSYPISIELGGSKVDLSAKPIDDERRVFETEHFVPTQ